MKKVKESIEVIPTIPTKEVSNSVTITEAGLTLEFKNPTPLIYSSVLSILNEDRIDGLELLFDNLYKGDSSKIEFDNKLLFFGKLYDEFLSGELMDVNTNDKSNFIITLAGDKSFTLKRPDRQLFKDLLKLSLKNIYKAWELLYNSCFLEGYKFDLTNKEDLRIFATSYTIVNIVLYNKQLDLKKKIDEFGDFSNEINQIDALIRYHYNLEPDNYNDDKWAELYSGINWILKEQNKRNK